MGIHGIGQGHSFKGGITKENLGIAKDDKNSFKSNIFSKVDVNNDGFLSKSELENFFNNVDTKAGKNQKLSNHETNKLLKEFGLKGQEGAAELQRFLSELQIASEGIEDAQYTSNGVSVKHTADENGNIQLQQILIIRIAEQLFTPIMGLMSQVIKKNQELRQLILIAQTARQKLL